MIYLIVALYLTIGYWCYTRARDKYPQAFWEIATMIFWPLILTVGVVIVIKEEIGEKKDE